MYVYCWVAGSTDHTYIRTYIPTHIYIHTYIHTYINIYIERGRENSQNSRFRKILCPHVDYLHVSYIDYLHVSYIDYLHVSYTDYLYTFYTSKTISRHMGKKLLQLESPTYLRYIRPHHLAVMRLLLTTQTKKNFDQSLRRIYVKTYIRPYHLAVMRLLLTTQTRAIGGASAPSIIRPQFTRAASRSHALRTPP